MHPSQFSKVLQVGTALIFFLSISVISLEASNNEIDLSVWSLGSVNRHVASESTTADNHTPIVAGFAIPTAAEAALPNDESNNTLLTAANTSSNTTAVAQQSCEPPYKSPSPSVNNSCDWLCDEGTVPSATTNECICEPGYHEIRKDLIGRRVCAPPNDQLDALRWEIIEQAFEKVANVGTTSYAVLKVTTSVESQVTLTYCESNFNGACLSQHNQKIQLSSEWKREHRLVIRGLPVNEVPSTVYFQLKALARDNIESTLPIAGSQYDWLGFQRLAYDQGDLVVSNIKPIVQNSTGAQSEYKMQVIIKNDSGGDIRFDEVQLLRKVLGIGLGEGIETSKLRLVIGTDHDAINQCGLGACSNAGNLFNEIIDASNPTLEGDSLYSRQERTYSFGSTSAPIYLTPGMNYSIKAIIDDSGITPEANELNNALMIKYTPQESNNLNTVSPAPVATKNNDNIVQIQQLLQRIEKLQFQISELEVQVVEREKARETKVDAALTDRLSGKLLIQPQERGEVWYLDPLTKQKYYLKDGEGAYQALRVFGLGISENDFNNTSNLQALRGRILLRVHSHGEAYFIDADGKAKYLKDGPAAYEIMRTTALGVSNIDLAKIGTGSLSIEKDY